MLGTVVPGHVPVLGAFSAVLSPAYTVAEHKQLLAHLLPLTQLMITFWSKTHLGSFLQQVRTTKQISKRG